MKVNLVTKKPTPHQALHEFILFAEDQVPNLIHNIKMLREKVPFDLKNPILTFLLNRTCNQVIEELVLRTHEGWNILNIELKALQQPILSITDQDYDDLDTMRNKLIAHRVQTGIYAKDNFTEWYSKKYGSFEETFSLIERAIHKILDRINKLEESDLLDSDHASIRLDKKFSESDITNLLDALKKAGIY